MIYNFFSLNMLIGSNKNRRRRKRRKKHIGHSLTHPTLENQQEDDTHQTTTSPKQDQRPIATLSNEFLQEDVEIETRMLIKRLTKDNELSRRKDKENNFFTKSLGFVDNGTGPIGDDEDLQANKEELLDVLPTPSSIRTTYQDDGPQLASSYVNDDDESLIKLYSKSKVELNDSELFVPNLNAPRVKHDIEHHGHSEFDLADYGHHIHEKPVISSMNRAQMIDRFIEENSTHWLQNDSSDLLKLAAFVCDKRLFKSECLFEFNPVCFTPIPVEMSTVLDTNGHKILKIQIENVVFEQHPTFNKEQKLAREIESLYDEYSIRKFNDIVGNVQMKLNVLRQLMANAPRKPTDLGAAAFKSHRLELRDLRNRLHRERKTDRDILASILSKWQELKKEREKSDPRTTLKLLIKTKDANAVQDEADWDFNFNMEFNEILQESMDFYREERQKLRNRTKNGDNTNYEDIPRLERPDSKVIREHLYDIYKNSVRPPGEQIIDLELDKYGYATEKSNDKKTMKDLPKYVIRVTLDATEVGCAETSRLNTKNGHASLNTVFSIKFVTNLPSELQLTVNSYKLDKIFVFD